MVRLKVEDTAVQLAVGGNEGASFSVGDGFPIYPTAYTGSYTVTPAAAAQTLNTAGLMMTENVTIEPIPSNYGLITWNGSTLTVS